MRVEKLLCRQCNISWWPRKPFPDLPQRCPSCGSRRWNDDDDDGEQEKGTK